LQSQFSYDLARAKGLEDQAYKPGHSESGQQGGQSIFKFTKLPG